MAEQGSAQTLTDKESGMYTNSTSSTPSSSPSSSPTNLSDTDRVASEDHSVPWFMHTMDWNPRKVSLVRVGSREKMVQRQYVCVFILNVNNTQYDILFLLCNIKCNNEQKIFTFSRTVA